MGARIPHHRRRGPRQTVRRQPELGRNQQYILLARPDARHYGRDPDAIPPVRRPQGACALRRLRARRLSTRRGDPLSLVARMERSVIRDRPTPDYAALHPGYGLGTATTFACYIPFPTGDDTAGVIPRRRFRLPAQKSG